MADYFDRFSEWRRKIQRTAREVDEQLGLSEAIEKTVEKTVEQTGKLAEEVRRTTSRLSSSVQRVAENAPEAVREVVREVTEVVEDVAEQLPDAQAVTSTVSHVVETVREEFKQFEEKHHVTENLRQAAEKVAGKVAEVGGETLRTGTETASEVAERASEAFKAVRETARSYYARAEEAYDLSARVFRATVETRDGYRKAREWVVANPGASALMGLSLLLGFRLGAAFPGLDRVVLGQSRHWLFHSGLAAYGAKKLAEGYVDFLREQEKLVAEGKLDEAAQARVAFQRKAARYVGAPLLGAFNIALGTALWAEIFSPGRIVGFPISIVLGGNPVLETVWLFGNGLVCIYSGYELVMLAFEDEADVQRIVRAIRALLPEGNGSRTA
ncbi:MAG: hypothetical protein NZ585_03105 [Chloracidobacterium sp.]|nr:hypothetical protein [Chloracidobacterium sp.]MDW8217266.1 hypothetical protein [Acidobacteriota bacterium]